ncbi:MAG: 30S ribosomal protein S15 [Bacteriovoracaceae bacterium]
MITKEAKSTLIKEYGTEFGKGEKDSGCAAVQIAILTTRINNLRPHFEKNIHDYSSNRGLLKMIGQRRHLSKYLQRTEPEKYQSLIKKLGLRK